MKEECWLKWFSQVIDSVLSISCIFSRSILQIQEAKCTVLSLRRKSYISNFPSCQADADIFPGLSGNMAFIKFTFRFRSFFILNEINSYYLIEPINVGNVNRVSWSRKLWYKAGLEKWPQPGISVRWHWRFFNRIYFTFAAQYYCSRFLKITPSLKTNLSIFTWQILTGIVP